MHGSPDMVWRTHARTHARTHGRTDERESIGLPAKAERPTSAQCWGLSAAAQLNKNIKNGGSRTQSCKNLIINKKFPRHNTAIRWFKAIVSSVWPSLRQIWCAVSKKMSENLIFERKWPNFGPKRVQKWPWFLCQSKNFHWPFLNNKISLNKTQYDWFPGKSQNSKKFHTKN